MIRRFASAALVALALALAAAPVRAQGPAAPAAEVSAQAADPTQALRGGVQTLQATGLPPRTPRAVWHVSAAYAITFLAIFGYGAMLFRRFRRIRREEDSLARQPAA